jgi:predicted transcriptional regulator
MRKSKFEIYIAILNTLVINGPMRSNKITCETNINYSYIKKALKDLRDKQLVEEKKISNSFIYLATDKAKLALSQFKEISENLPIFEEAQVS